MKKIKIRDKECNCSNIIYWHIKGLESENRLFSMEIKGHEDCKYELQQENERLKEYMKNTYDTSQDLLSEMQKRIDKAIEVLGQYRHYCVPDEIANRENEELVEKAYEILGGEDYD